MERPQVVITDPRAPQRPADVLEADGSPRGSRRLVLAVVGVVVALLAAQVVSQVRERRAADAEERRLRALVSLEPVARFENGLSEQYEPGGDRARLVYALGVRNTGPREVRVVDGALGELRLVAEVDVPPGAERRLVLEQEVDCSTRPAEGTPAAQARLTIRSQDGSGTPYDVDAGVGDFATTAPARACRYLEPAEALFAEPVVTDTGDGFVDARYGLLSFGRGPVEVSALGTAAGLRAELLDAAGRPLALPLVVPANDPPEVDAPLFVVVRFRVDDCARVPARSEDPFTEAASDLTFTTRGDGEDTYVAAAQPSDPLAVRRLVEQVC